MGRPRTITPKYSRHAASGSARVSVNGRHIYLGPYNSPESRKEYRRIIAELAAANPAPDAPTTPANPTVAEVVAAFWRHAKKHYRDADGNPTSEIKWLGVSLKLLVELYGHTPAREFGPLALKALRTRWVKGGICRKSVNGRANRVRRVFKWAASEELVPFVTYQALTTVAGLQAGRTEAGDRGPVEPVPNLHVVAAASVMVKVLRDMVMIQRLAGMRPGELCRMRVGDVDRERTPWSYRPRHHKTAYRGGTREVLIGPQAAELLAPYLVGRGPDEFVFTPMMARKERYATLRAVRKSKVQPSQRCRAKPPSKLKVPPAPAFTTIGYAARVRGACRKAGVPAWFPNQLRHSFATEVREAFGLEAAQVLLGHSRADVTQVYAERNAGLAAQVAAKAG